MLNFFVKFMKDIVVRFYACFNTILIYFNNLIIILIQLEKDSVLNSNTQHYNIYILYIIFSYTYNHNDYMLKHLRNMFKYLCYDFKIKDKNGYL